MSHPSSTEVRGPGDGMQGLLASLQQLELDKEQVLDRKTLEQEVQDLKAAMVKKDAIIAKKDETINEQSEKIARQDYTINGFIFRSGHQKKIIAEQKRVLDKYGLGSEVSTGPHFSAMVRNTFSSRYRPEPEEQEMLE